MSQEKKLEAFLTAEVCTSSTLIVQFTIGSLQGLKIGLLYKRAKKLTRFRTEKCQPAIFCIFVRDTKTLKILMTKKNKHRAISLVSKKWWST